MKKRLVLFLLSLLFANGLVLPKVIDQQLIYEVRDGNVEKVKQLLNNDADPDIERYGETPLGWAAMNCCEKIVRVLLEYGANPNIIDGYGRTPICWAARRGHENIVQMLLDHSVDPNKNEGYRTTPLYEAAQKGHTTVVRMLLNAGANPNGVNKPGETLRRWNRIRTKSQKEIFDMMFGIGHYHKDYYGETALHTAVRSGHASTVRILLAAGADPNKVDKYGVSPLHWAAEKGFKNIIQILFSFGANPTIREKEEGDTPLDVAKNFEIKSYIEKLAHEQRNKQRKK